MLFLLVGAPALANKPDEKTPICHVGNKVGPGGETYADDPDCQPAEGNGYFCPDAGKIDLIEVAKPQKHLGNASPTYNGISDYPPADVGASGVNAEDGDDSDFIGIIASIEDPAVIRTMLVHLDEKGLNVAESLVPDCRASPGSSSDLLI